LRTKLLRTEPGFGFFPGTWRKGSAAFYGYLVSKIQFGNKALNLKIIEFKFIILHNQYLLLDAVNPVPNTCVTKR